MTITATEFKENFGKYLDLAAREDIFITKNGRVVAQLSQPQSYKLDVLNELVGLAEGNGDVSLDRIKKERLSKQWDY